MTNDPTKPDHLAVTATNPWVLKLKDAGERALSAFGEQALAVVGLSSGIGVLTLTGLPWAAIFGTGLGAIVISLALSVAQFSLGAQVLPYWADLLTRVAKTFVASLIGTVSGGAIFNVLDVSWLTALNVAAAAAFASLIKNLLSPNAHLSGSLLTTPTVAAIYGVSVNGSGFKKAV